MAEPQALILALIHIFTSLLQGQEGDKVINQVFVDQSTVPQATVFIIEDFDRQHTFQVLQLNVFLLSSSPPKVQSRLRYKVPAYIAEKDEDGFALRHSVNLLVVVWKRLDCINDPRVQFIHLIEYENRVHTCTHATANPLL
ncbi:hypothetical protein P7K49_030951 [Saguinus oedipus]|uniref:Uncharacterized protein n=1 Tax=Saguinus oedipus TaxID=9490 RepID=A0ABQ9U3L9_SAGOE|nr:hypothetical protein P7K49_030951 [Saguinus oedipus]